MHCRASLPSKVSCFPTRQRHEKGSTFLRGCYGTADDDEKAMASQDQSQTVASQQPTERTETSACAASEPVVALGNQPDWEMFERRWKDADDVSEDGTVCTDIVGEYEFVRMLGAGRYGRTFHAVHRKSRAEVAMKVYSFRRLVRSSEEMHGNSSRDERLPHPKEFNGEVVKHRVRVFRLEKLLTRCLTGLSPFVTALARGGVTDTSVCDLKRGEIGYLSELMPGDIHRVWRKWAKVDDPEGRERENFRHMHVFIAAQITDAVRFLHCCGVVHHDLSTGNILIGRDGYIKVTDFGRSSVICNPEDSPASVAAASAFNLRSIRREGPPEDMWRYLVHKNDGERRRVAGGVEVRHSVDLHMLGYLLLRLDWPVDFSSPIYGDVEYDENSSTFDRFARSYRVTRRPVTIAGPMADFIEQLLCPDPRGRIGHQCPEDMLHHPVFNGIDFERLRRKEEPAPIGPGLRGVFDGGLARSRDNELRAPWRDHSNEEVFMTALHDYEKEAVMRLFARL